MFKLIYIKPNTLAFILLFFLVISPHLLIFNLTIKTAYFFVLVPALIGFYKYCTIRVNSSYLFITILFMLLSMIYHVLAYFIHGLIDISWVVRLFYGFIEFFAALTFGMLYVKIYGNIAFHKLITHIFFIGVIHSILMIVLFLFPTFRDFLYSVVVLTDLAHSATFRDDGFLRLSGLLNTGFGSLSVLNASLFLCGLLAYVHLGSLRLYSFLFGSLTIFFSSMLSGRIGLVVSAVMFFLIVIFSINFRFARIKVLNLILVALPIILFSIIFLEENYPNITAFAFETYYNYKDFGELDNSTNLILNEEKLESRNNIIHVFFGDGNYIVELDMGYRVLLSGGGYVGTIISFVFIFAFFFVKSNPYFKSIRLNMFILIFIITIFVINFKNVYLFGYNDIFQVFFLIICTASLNSNYSVIKNKSVIW
jgi:hypothetical protein